MLEKPNWCVCNPCLTLDHSEKKEIAVSCYHQDTEFPIGNYFDSQVTAEGCVERLLNNHFSSEYRSAISTVFFEWNSTELAHHEERRYSISTFFQKLETPRDAKIILEKSNTGNRNMRIHKVKEYTSLIKKGQWVEMNGDTISFDIDGRLGFNN